MIVIWGGFLAIMLDRIRRQNKPYTLQKVHYSVDEQIKRIGVYYMCIDDLSL